MYHRPPAPAASPAQRAFRLSYNFPLTQKPQKTIEMEAERLNAIENLLADLRRRAGELRGYL